MGKSWDLRIAAGRAGVAAGALLLAACGSAEPGTADGGVPPVGTGGPFVSAHRGGAAYAPENTLMAYRNAARLYVDDFETDTWLSADGVPVLMHDDTLDRTTNCSGKIADHTLAELSACDAGYWYSPGQDTTRVDEGAPHPARGKGVTIPTAQALFDFAASFRGAYRPTVTIEIKNFAEAFRAAEVLVPMIQASGIKDRIIVQSFNPLALDRIKQLDGDIRTLYLTPSALGAGVSLTYAALRGHDFVAPQSTSRDLDAAFVERAQALGKQVVPWTPDSEAELQRLSEMGVDGLITNYPGCVLALQARLPSTRLLAPELGSGDVPLCSD